jgi:hypothetical protein
MAIAVPNFGALVAQIVFTRNGTHRAASQSTNVGIEGISCSHRSQAMTRRVRLARERWKPDGKAETPMTSLGVDVARGGADKTVLSPRFGNWFAKQIVYPRAPDA